MGHSATYHVIGQTAIIPKEDGKDCRRLYPAMNRVEMEQQRAKASKDGTPITSWYSQTGTGQRILGDAFGWVIDSKAPKVKLVTCSVCQGEGQNGAYHCPICDGSGICKPGNEKRWQSWQIEEMIAERSKSLVSA